MKSTRSWIFRLCLLNINSNHIFCSKKYIRCSRSMSYLRFFLLCMCAHVCRPYCRVLRQVCPTRNQKVTIYESPYRIQRLVFSAGFCQGLHDFHGVCQDLHGFLGFCEGLHDFCGFCQEHNSKQLQLNVELNFIICDLRQSSTLKFTAMRRIGGVGGGGGGGIVPHVHPWWLCHVWLGNSKLADFMGGHF